MHWKSVLLGMRRYLSLSKSFENVFESYFQLMRPDHSLLPLHATDFIVERYQASLSCFFSSFFSLSFSYINFNQKLNPENNNHVLVVVLFNKTWTVEKMIRRGGFKKRRIVLQEWTRIKHLFHRKEIDRPVARVNLMVRSRVMMHE